MEIIACTDMASSPRSLPLQQPIIIRSSALGFSLVDRVAREQCLATRPKVSKRSIGRILDGDASLAERWRIGPRRLGRHIEEEVVNLSTPGNLVIDISGAIAVLRPFREARWIHLCDVQSSSHSAESSNSKTWDCLQRVFADGMGRVVAKLANGLPLQNLALGEGWVLKHS